MEISDLVLLGCMCAFVSAIFSAIFALALHYVRNRDLEAQLRVLTSRIESVDMSVRGYAGRNSRTERTERLEAAVGEAALMLKDGKPPEEIMKALAPKYGDLIMPLLRKQIGI